ncbi:hypothetical protein [Chlamydiifrater phoenicopteri]|uniref:hypothetical protein n=1 Tax=Chlamydiifrater phoenicopteri TaxID=2681469 RepID=UPI001BCE9726|nr:hypothetical protein [Chlamydiifrater phoenicopteri]
MSLPLDSTLTHLTHSFPQEVSLEERITSNFKAIRDVILQRTPQTISAQYLYNQLFAIRRQGFGLRTISEALSISNISLRILVQTDQTLSAPQYTEILSSCRDLLESSGSCSSFQTLTPSLSAQEPDESHLPLKKRKHILQEFIKPHTEEIQTPELSEVALVEPLSPLVIDIKETDLLEEQTKTYEQSLSPLTFLLETIAREHPISSKPPSRSLIQCPEMDPSEDKHECATCSLTRKIFPALSYLVRKQLSILLDSTTRESLAEALLNLPFIGEIEKLPFRHHFSHLEIAHIIAKCNIGNEICLPGRKNPAGQIPFYNSLIKVISSGLSHPLTQTILETWRTAPSIAHAFYEEESSGILILKDNEPQLVYTGTLEPMFSNVEQRYFHQGRSKRYQLSMSQGYRTFLSSVILFTLYALKHSPQGAPHLLPTDKGPAFSWAIVEHLFNLVLCANPSWKVAVVATRASIGPAEELSFSDDETAILSQALLRFTNLNNLFLRGQSMYNASS